MRPPFADANRGVRDLIGFILVFTVVVTAVGLTATTGYAQLSEFSENQRLENTERAMDLTASSIAELVRGSAVSRSSELNLEGGSIRVLSPSSRTMTVSVFDGGGTRTCCNGGDPIPVGSLAIERKNTVMAYESGALFRSLRGNTALLRQPPVRCRGGTVTVGVVTLRPAGGSPIQTGGDGTVSVTARVATSEALYPTGTAIPDPERVTVEFSPDSAAGWRQALRQEGDWTQTSPTTFECTGVQTVTVHRTVVDVSLSG